MLSVSKLADFSISAVSRSDSSVASIFAFVTSSAFANLGKKADFLSAKEKQWHVHNGDGFSLASLRNFLMFPSYNGDVKCRPAAQKSKSFVE